ncbi:MAG: hypothetical protein AB2A00_14695 [Myxococcota bacterium]
METAKVDIRKLQLLNDRINQTIDALHQLRLSVHGVQSTPTGVGVPQAGIYGQPGFSHTTGISPLQNVAAYYGQGINPLIAQQGLGQPWGVGGLSHTGVTPFFNPLLANIVGQQGYNPFVAQQAYNPLMTMMGGLSHTGISPVFNPFISGLVGQQGYNPMMLGQQWGGMGGLSHTGFAPQVNPLAALVGQLGVVPQMAQYGQPGFTVQPGIMGGLSHTGVSPFINPLLANLVGQQGYTPQQWAGQGVGIPSFLGGLSHTGFSPITTSLLGQQGYGVGLAGLQNVGVGGLSHTTPDVGILSDPSWVTRVAQTFPYAFSPIPVNGSGLI